MVSFEIGGIPGCMDATACNYDDLATEDDGSCCLTNCVDLTIVVDHIRVVSWEILDASATVIYSGGGTEYSGTICLDNGTYMINGYDSWGDGCVMYLHLLTQMVTLLISPLMRGQKVRQLLFHSVK